MNYTDETMQAVQWAIELHGEQRRKYNGQPFVLHPIRVMRMCRMHTRAFQGEHVTEQEVWQTAVLHDTAEDVLGFDAKLINERFGETVYYGVLSLTNPSKLCPNCSRDERKRMDREHIRLAPKWVRQIKLFDRLDNLRDMQDAPADFLRDRYLPESRALLECLGDCDQVLVDMLNAEILETCQRIGLRS